MKYSMLFKIVAVALLLSGGIALTITAPRSSTAAGGNFGSGSTLDTTWTASGFVNVKAGAQDGPILGPVTIGVTKWHNVTTQNGQTLYTEDWSADIPSGNVSFGSSGGNPTINLPSGYTSQQLTSNWLYGGGLLNLSNSWPIEFSFTSAPSDQRVLPNVGRQNFKAIGNSLDCRAYGGNAVCLGATGSYGFGSWQNMGDGLNDFPAGFGSFMPTKWTVHGTFQ